MYFSPTDFPMWPTKQTDAVPSWSLSAHTWLAAWSIRIHSIPLLASEVAEDETNIGTNSISKKIWTSLHVPVFTLWFYLKYSVNLKKNQQTTQQVHFIPSCTYKWAQVKVLQSCLTLCDSIDCTVHGIFQARILEKESSQPWDMNPRFPYCRRSLYQPRATREAHTYQRL